MKSIAHQVTDNDKHRVIISETGAEFNVYYDKDSAETIVKLLDAEWMSPRTDNNFSQGDVVILKELPGAMGYDHLEPDTFLGDVCIVNYINGCCLCVTTTRGVEFTANHNRFAHNVEFLHVSWRNV